MTKYAERTAVTPEQRRGEIERTLARYGATAFGYATSGDRAQVVFELSGRRMRLDVALPDRQSKEFTHLESSPWVQRAEAEAQKRYDQAVRQRWAALALWIKAQCEAIDSEVVTAEQAFLGWVVLPDGRTLAEKIAPQLDAAYASGDMPALMAGTGR
jgi:hypothetical protein